MRKILTVTVFSIAAIGLMASVSNAAPFSTTKNASVKIVEPLNVTTTADLNFGAIQKVTSGTGTVTIAASSTVTPTGTVTTNASTTSLGGAIASGVYSVVGDSAAAINISVAATGTPPAGLSLTNFTATYGGSAVTLTAGVATGLTAPGAAPGKVLGIGATLNVASTVADGVYSTVPYTITVSYQ